MNKLFLFCFLILSPLITLNLTSCHWVGETTGKAKAKIERKVDSVEQGYEEGYEQEKAKTAKPSK
jgi:hypothetical protein